MLPQEGPQQTAEGFDSQEFLTGLGIESFAGAEVKDHEGKLMPLEQALVVCPAARDQLRATVELVTTMGGDLQSTMQTYFSGMRDRTPELTGAKSGHASGEAEKK